MHIKSKVIVLSKAKYGDNDLIVNCYTQHRGFVSYMVKGAFKSTKKNISKSIYFQPLMQLAVEENYNPKRQLQYLKEVKPNYVFKTLHSNIYKSAIVLFLSEVLTMVLKTEEQNEDLFDFLETVFQYLDTETHFSNFHLLFLIELTRYLGFKPDEHNAGASYFNFKSGYFQSTSDGLYTVSDKNLVLLKTLLGINFDELSVLKLGANERNAFLNILLLYFELHLEGFTKPKSLHVLTEVFH